MIQTLADRRDSTEPEFEKLDLADRPGVDSASGRSLVSE
jgi:hypothetical protein